jgi:hypothetical protein
VGRVIKFVNEDELDPTDLCLKPKDPSISSWCDRPEVGDAMFWILVDSYRKDKVSLTQSMIDFKGIFKRKDDQEVVEELFELTKNPTDWMASQQVEEMMQAKPRASTSLSCALGTLPRSATGA